MRIIIIVFVFFTTFAQKKEVKITETPKKLSNHDTIILKTPNIIQIESIKNNTDNNVDWSKNMPWIGAITIGLTTVIANIITSNLLRKSNTIATNQQIENTKTISAAQIELAKTNSERDFKKTVLSTARQLWINDFRNIISEVLSLTAFFSLKQKMDDENNLQFNLLLTKAELMLSSSSSHLELKKQLEELKSGCLDMMMQNIAVDELDLIVVGIKNKTITILGEEWDKASKAE